jgi:hypothetical protein
MRALNKPAMPMMSDKDQRAHQVGLILNGQLHRFLSHRHERRKTKASPRGAKTKIACHVSQSDASAPRVAER